MDITSKTVTHRVHTATATVDMLRGVAIAAVTKQLGLADSAILSSDATLGADGAITVEVVEAVAEASKVDAPNVDAPPVAGAKPAAPELVI